MSAKKWIPWNWFKKEEDAAGSTVPVRHTSGRNRTQALNRPLEHFHLEVDRLFDQALRGFGFSPFGFNQVLGPPGNGAMLKPTLDLSANDKEYTIALEIPGVDENDVNLEIVNDTLTIQGEKNTKMKRKAKTTIEWNALTARSNGRFRYRMMSTRTT